MAVRNVPSYVRKSCFHARVQQHVLSHSISISECIEKDQRVDDKVLVVFCVNSASAPVRWIERAKRADLLPKPAFGRQNGQQVYKPAFFLAVVDKWQDTERFLMFVGASDPSECLGTVMAA